uniref:Uncharacterized protein n=1 Tax=Rangifer tarandus platyrhynchus TaxID=3082113 RepID=A0ACB0F2A5_RANTA|nr:unnamed protein product [Rangifer tarandus platyrhynchus]
MSSSEGSSDMKTDHEFHEDESESLPDLEAQGALASDSSLSSVASTHSGPRVKSVTFKKCNIRDRNQQVLVLEGGVLKAVPDKDVTARETFYISVSHRRVVKPTNEGKNHIYLAVSKGEFCLYCEKAKGPKPPSLQLKKKHIKELSSLKAKDCLPFTFIKEQVGSYFTLESAANPGYFIYTSNKPGQPIGMTKELGQAVPFAHSAKSLFLLLVNWPLILP